MSSQPIITTIDSLSHEGRGIASLEGKTTFVEGALPGETVTLHIQKKHRRYNEATIINVLTPAKDRVSPVCPHAALCGGCSMQHLDMTAQIEHKTRIVTEHLHHFGKVSPTSWLPIITGQTVGYRRKARLGVRYVYKKEKLLIGFREKSSRYLADLSECHVLDPRVGMKLTALASCIQQLSCYTEIPQVEVACSDEDVALIFRHLAPLNENDINLLKQFGQTHHLQIWLQPNSAASVHKIWPEDNKQHLSYFLPEFQLEMRFHPLDFTQVNHDINPRMIQKALSLLDLKPEHRVLDLFCGLGNFTLPIARHAAEVVGIEGSEEMVKRATENAHHNQLHNTHFYAADLMSPNTQASWLQQKYDRILLDPPRSGAKEILPLIAQCNAERIVYVSCNPATFARDAGELVHQYGYQLIHVGLINMFPHTTHIEVIALFSK